MNLPKANALNTLNDRAPLRSVAVVLEVAATVSVVMCGLYYLYLKVSFEPTTEDLYRARIGSHLLPFVTLAAMILVLGVAVSRPKVTGRNAYRLAVIVAVVSIALSAGAAVHVQRQLHPPLTAERAALAKFVPPPDVIGQSTSVSVTEHPVVRRDWNVRGQAATVCAAAQSSLVTWADPGTVAPAAEPMPGCSWVARKGSDHVSLAGFYVPGVSGVSLELALTRIG